MQVVIKDFSVDMAIKNKGIELQVSGSDGKHRGDLVVTKTKLIWCPGRTSPKNGRPISWEKFIAYMEENH